MRWTPTAPARLAAETASEPNFALEGRRPQASPSVAFVALRPIKSVDSGSVARRPSLILSQHQNYRPLSGGLLFSRLGVGGTEPHALRPHYGRRSTATASATTATSEAMVYGFGSHPSGA